MIGNAAEGLQAHHVRNAVMHHRGHLAGQQPTFAKLRRQRHKILGPFGQFIHIVEGAEIAERTTSRVDLFDAMFHQTIKTTHQQIGQLARLYARPKVFILIYETLQEEITQHRRFNLYAVVDKPLRDAALRIPIELQEDFSHNAHKRTIAVPTNGIKFLRSRTEEGHQLL